MGKKFIGGIVAITVFLLGLFLLFPDDGTTNKPSGDTSQVDSVNNKKESASESKTGAELPNVKLSDWNLILVNRDHPVKSEDVDLAIMKNGYEIEKRVYQPYYDLESAANAAGFSLTVLSSYRTVAAQIELYQTDVTKYMAEGLSEEEAKKKTEEYVTRPRTSEHHTGLALDVVEQEWYASGKGLDAAFYDTPAGKWLDTNAPKFGFIIRYPRNKESITGINYEPWHLRYVGIESAVYIQKNGLTLEEYLDKLVKSGN